MAVLVDKPSLQEYADLATEKYKNLFDIKNILIDSYYSDAEIPITQTRLYDTDCYIAEIPMMDSQGDLIKPYVGYEYGSTPLLYAQKNGTTMTTNNCIAMHNTTAGGPNIFGNIIGAGTVLREEDVEAGSVVPNRTGYLTISEDRQTVKTFPITTTLAELQADPDVWNCMTYYYPLVEDEQVVDNSGTICNETGVVTQKNPRLSIGVKSDKTLVIVACDGRTAINAGLTSDELAAVMINRGCTDAWNMDGGGSTSFDVRGEKWNRNFKGNGTQERVIPFTFNVRKGFPEPKHGITDIYGQIGAEKQRTIAQIIPLVNEMQDQINELPIDYDYIGKSLNDVTETSLLYCQQCTEYPTGESHNGFCLTIVRKAEQDTITGVLAFQMYKSTDFNSNLYFRIRKYSPAYPQAWGNWRKLTVLPDMPTIDGQYQLTCTVTNGTPTMAWNVTS